MAKPKLKQPPNKNCTPSGPDMEECVQDGWVVVKKQKVTILIPALPIPEHCTMPNPAGSPSQPIPTKEVEHIPAPQPDPPVTIEKTMPLATAKPITTFSNPPKLNHRAIPGNLLKDEPNCHRTLRICSAPKARKHCGNLLNGHMLVNSKMRALNLERKLQRAGGLNNWLVSLGLGQFVKIFRCRHVGKVQLVNLTMKKLKDMGAVAVGPRRKLMHAIDCLW
ncbi:hypothetical protein L6452_11328 [Arctium lappa]|uniref:Uncharacterized protein n=1 Tax=Arctium lappa TaxID=4217 RepID=A0ACB9DP45_ARCLA|nr:hypothetical protein L6452_11328 [Arctium lappa]